MENENQGLSTDNRWSDRRELHLNVEIFRSGVKLCNCTSQDFGLGGTRLQLNDSDCDSFGGQQDVELIFHVPNGEHQTRYTLQSKLVWCEANNAGLKFQEFNTSVFRSLQELMNYKFSN